MTKERYEKLIRLCDIYKKPPNEEEKVEGEALLKWFNENSSSIQNSRIR